MRYRLKLFVLTVSVIWLSQLVACWSSVPRDLHAEDQSNSQSQQSVKEGKQGDRAAQAGRRNEETMTDAQLQALLKMEFEGLFEPNGKTISPSYLLGDFNGDDVLDIAIPVRLIRSIEASDKTESPFWFGKPLGPGMAQDDERYRFKMGDLNRYRNESILIVLHGVAGRGWNHSEPKQKYVIVDGWDAGKINMASYRGKLKPVAAGDGAIEPPPRLLGDAILMLGQENKGTALYCDGNKYRWYPVAHDP